MTGQDETPPPPPPKKTQTTTTTMKGKGGKPFTDQTDGGGRGFTCKLSHESGNPAARQFISLLITCHFSVLYHPEEAWPEHQVET